MRRGQLRLLQLARDTIDRRCRDRSCVHIQPYTRTLGKHRGLPQLSDRPSRTPLLGNPRPCVSEAPARNPPANPSGHSIPSRRQRRLARLCWQGNDGPGSVLRGSARQTSTSACTAASRLNVWGCVSPHTVRRKSATGPYPHRARQRLPTVKVQVTGQNRDIAAGHRIGVPLPGVLPGPAPGVVVAHVPWARHDAGHTYVFDEQVAWLATQNSNSAMTLARLRSVTSSWSKSPHLCWFDDRTGQGD
jgi:hypothetical protein